MVAVRRFLALVLVTVLAEVTFVAGVANPATAAGTVLLNESFSGTSVKDPGWQPLNDACLT